MKLSVSTSFLAAGKCQVRWLGRRRRRRGRKEWKKSHTTATRRLCLVEGCDFKTERGEEWNVKVGEQWSAVFPPVRPEEPTSTSTISTSTSSSSPLVGTFLISLPRWSLSQHYSRPVEFPGGGRASSSGSRPHIKMTKQRNPPPKTTRWSQMRGRKTHEGSRRGGGNESQGSRWMVRRALSGISYRHTVNHSSHFFPVLRTVQGETTKLQLWCFFLT